MARAVAPGFGGINLVDIAAPACFEVEERELDDDFVIPSVFDRRVAPAVSGAVQETVEQAGLSRLVESG